MHEIPENDDALQFPQLSDEAVIAIDQFLEDFCTHFQNHYFAQIYRYYSPQRQCHRDIAQDQMPLPLDDPPF